MKNNMNKNETARLTENDKKILKKIIAAGRITDTIMAKDIHLSQQAVQKIRTKLEKIGVIKGYIPVIDFSKLNVSTINIVGVKVSARVWKKFSEQEVSDKLINIPYVFRIFRVPSSNISHMIMLGFRDIFQRDQFMRRLETSFSDELELVWTYTLSVENIVSENPLSLLYDSINKKVFTFDELFLTKKEKQD